MSKRKLSRRKVAEIYRVPESTLRLRMNGHTSLHDHRPANHDLTDLQEQVIINYILNRVSRVFSPQQSDVGNMANYLRKTRRARPVGKLWAHRFIQRLLELKTRLNRVYDFQRVFCENFEPISTWFRLMENIRAKYGVVGSDFYNFDETGFMIGQTTPGIVVTRTDRRGRAKGVQPGNQEWATTIISINSEGWDVPPFLLIQSLNHLANWYSETNLPRDWVIKPPNNGWANNETSLEWLKHFNKHTATQAKGPYRMLVLDGNESHESIEFQDYCKSHNIITLGLPPHSSHLTQSLDIGCFSVLKQIYGRQIEDLMKAYINHITKVEFFIIFKAAYPQSITVQNAQAGFRGADLIPFDPQAVISKLDVKLRTPTPIGHLSTNTNP